MNDSNSITFFYNDGGLDLIVMQESPKDLLFLTAGKSLLTFYPARSLLLYSSSKAASCLFFGMLFLDSVSLSIIVRAIFAITL